MRMLLIFLAGICACNAAAISKGDENILLKAILNASNDQNSVTKRPIWTIFKSLFLQGIHNEDEGNLGDRETSDQEAVVLQNSLRRNDKKIDEKGISKNVMSANAIDEISKNENVHSDDSENIGFNISKNENMSRKQLDGEKSSTKPIESSFSETQFELEIKSETYDNFTLNSDYTTDFLILQEDLDSIESLSVNENDLMRGGGEIALFQEMPATEFEFLIDSETKRNMILTQLFTSPNLALEDFIDMEESLDLGSALANLSLDEGVVVFNITEEEKLNKSSMQEIFNVTKDWIEFSKATGLREDGFNFNVSNDLPIVNVKLPYLPKESSFKHSESSPVTLKEDEEAEFSGMLLANASMNKSQDFNKLSKVELKGGNFTSNTSDFDYEEPTDLHNFEDFFVSGIQIPLLNLSKTSETDETVPKPEIFDLVNNSQGILEKENVGKEIFSLNTINDRGDIINSSDFTDKKELFLSIPLTHVALDENGREELNTKIPIEVFNVNLSHTLLSTEKAENLHSSMADFDRNSNKMELMEFKDSSHSSFDTVPVALGEDKKLALNTTQVQDIFSIASDANILSEGTERTLFVLSSSNYTNESTRIGETSDNSKEEFKNFLPRTQSSDLNKSSTALPYEEMLNLTHTEVFYETKIAENAILNTADFSSSITKFEDFTNFEDYPTFVFENHTVENGDAILNMKSIPKADDVLKDLEEFSGQSETENFRLNVTDVLQNRPSQPTEDATRERLACPAPGLCILWFFARDSCIEDSQCHRAQKCCKIGCSNMCISV